MDTVISPPKRRILYIRHQRSYGLAEGFRMNQDEWVETMSMLADVSLMTEDFDLDQACDQIRPDFILYEAPFLSPRPIAIANPKSHPAIPRIGLQIQDPYCATCVNFSRMVEILDIGWIFTHMADLLLRITPELKSRVFSIGHLFDDRIFYDYKLDKDIPVSIFGAFLVPEMYRWRAEAVADMPQYFPTFLYTHPGYLSPVPRHKFPVTGEKYARLLNRSHFSLADTTLFDCVVRKHLEIPASGAVLVAPDTSALKPYGFRDMENCVLGSGKALYDKIGAVAENHDLYEKIRQSGHDMVHAKYSRKHWRGILDFYECLRGLKPGETIRQPKIMGPFEVVPATPPDRPPPALIVEQYPDNEMSLLAKLWLSYLISGEGLDEIEKKMSQLAGWLAHITQHWIPLGIAALLKGNGELARDYFLHAQALRQKNSDLDDFDPEEVAWLSLTAALTGDANLLKLTRRLSASMHHLSLRRIQWLGEILAGRADADRPPREVLHCAAQDRLSIYWTGQMDIKDWLGLMSRILDKHGQDGASCLGGKKIGSLAHEA